VAITVLFVLISLPVMLVPVVSLLGVPLGVLLTGGLMLGCEALDRGEPLRIGHLFAGFAVRPGPLVGVGGLYLAASLLVMLVVGGLLWQFVTPLLATMSVQQGVVDPGRLQALLGAVLAISLLAMVPISIILCAVWFAPALVVLDGCDAIDAVRGSLVACLRNWRPFLVYGVVALVLLLVALVPLGLGLLVVLPVLVASVHAGWRSIFSAAPAADLDTAAPR